MTETADLAALMGPVARILLGEPNQRLSSKRELRYGTNGSMSVDLEKGVWHNHESNEGGGVLDLIKRGEVAEPIDWLIEHNLLDQRPRTNGSYRGSEGWDQPEPPIDETPHSGRRIVQVYDYTDISGAVIYQVVRYEPKGFSQRQPVPGEPGIWIWGLTAGEYMRPGPGRDYYRFDAERWEEFPSDTRQLLTLPRAIPHGLYKFWDVRERPDEIVLVPEGEKDVEALLKLGLSATCNSGGATNWTAEHAAALAGYDVVVLVDNDEAGRKRGHAIAKSLSRLARRVRYLDLKQSWPAMPNKGDVSDWIGQGGTADLLLALVDDLPDWTPPPFQSHFGLVWFNDLDADKAPEHEWLIDDWLTAGDISMNFGSSRSGKSFLAIHASMSVARGTKFFGLDVKRGGVVYQAGEGTKGVKNRFRAYRQHFGIPPNEKVPLAVLRSPIDVYHKDGDTAKLIEEIKALAEMMPVPLALVVIDTLATATAGADENSAKDMSAVLRNISKISAETGAHVMLVHHKPASGDRPRGHTSVFANLDNAIEVVFNETTKVRTMSNAKQKDNEEAKDIQFELLSVELGRRPNGKPITSCICLPLGEKELAQKQEVGKGFKLRDAEAILYRALVDAINDKGEQPPADEPDIPRTVRVARYSFWRDKYASFQNFDPDDPNDNEEKRRERIKRQITRVGDTLHRYGLIGRKGKWAWITGKRARGFADPLSPRLSVMSPQETQYQSHETHSGTTDDNPGTDEIVPEMSHGKH